MKTEEPHPWHGPCDGFAPDGSCAACYILTPTTAEDRYHMLMRGLEPFDGRRLINHLDNALAILEIEKIRTLLGEVPKQEKSAPAWHEGMREARPNTCWRYLDDTGRHTVCIRERGHDGGTHEPEEKGEQT